MTPPKKRLKPGPKPKRKKKAKPKPKPTFTASELGAVYDLVSRIDKLQKKRYLNNFQKAALEGYHESYTKLPLRLRQLVIASLTN